MTSVETVAVLEIGGTHASSGLVSGSGEGVSLVEGSMRRRTLDGSAPADALLDVVAEPLAQVLDAVGPETPCVVALPGPFDYVLGIGDFRGVGKFGAWRDVDVRAGLAERVGRCAQDLLFVNDAVAFAVGEQAAGVGRGHARVLGLTLGTGVGSAFLIGDTVVTSGPGVPPQGRMDLVLLDGRPLEQLISRTAIRERYQALGGVDGSSGDDQPDVVDIVALARAGQPAATRAVGGALAALGLALRPVLLGFRPDALIVGGSIARSWDVVGGMLQARLGQEIGRSGILLPAGLGACGPLLGAAEMRLRAARRLSR